MPVQPLLCGPAGPGPGGESCCSPAITSAQLCRDDGTPVLVVLRSPCVCGTNPPADPEAVGWLDPLTGSFTPGPVPAGTGPCTVGGGCASVTVLPLCDTTPDGTVTAFLRHLVHDCEGAVTAATDTLDDGTTPYTPSGDIGECAPCEPVPMCPQLLGLSGPETWEMPAGTESVSVTVVCGPVTVTDCTGAATVITECGTAFTWGAPSTSACEPGRLCAPFTVDVPDGAAVYISFLSPCDQLGDVS